MTETVLKRPLLICPPWINKFYILDLNPQKSFIRWAVEQGHTVFVISWVNPDERQARRAGRPISAKASSTGWTSSRRRPASGGQRDRLLRRRHAARRHAVADGAGRRRSHPHLTFFTTQVDFTHAGDLKVFVDEEQVAAVERSMNDKGYLEGTKMAIAFNMLRSGDLIWPYVVNNYMSGKEPTPFDLLYWNANSTRMGAANHSFYLRNCYLENNLTQRRMVLAGHKVSLGDIKIPIYNLASREDHIAPAQSVFLGSQYFGGEVDYVMAGSGHIAGVINPPAREEIPVLDRRQAGRRFPGLDRQGDGKPGIVVAALAKMDRGQGRQTRCGAPAGQENEGARRRAGILCQGPGMRLARPQLPPGPEPFDVDGGLRSWAKSWPRQHHVASFRP